MIEPALSQLRVGQAFASMSAAIDDYEQRLCAQAASAQPLSLDVAMSHLTADIICRTVFSTSLDSGISRQVFESFKVFERSVAQVEIKRLIWDRAWQPAPQRPQVLEACATIRACLGQLLDPHLNNPAAYNDICTALMGAVDPQEGHRFNREELLDQLGVMFLAGHETTASVLIWVFFVLSQQPRLLQRVRDEVQQVVGSGPVLFEHIRQLSLVRNVFREALRLYPPITFIPRVASEDTRIGSYAVKRGAMVMISPWTIHRNESLWPDAHRFDPDRFDATREQEQVAGAYLPVGLGPRVCAGAAFANTEAVLILARLVRRFDLVPLAPQRVRPVARLTTRPREPIVCRVTLRGSAA
jgi:cytochrome P450